MTSEELLNQYSKATADLAAFELIHSDVLAEYRKLQENVEAIKKNVIDAAKSMQQDFSIGDTIFRFSQPYRKYIDYDVALKIIGKKNQTKLDEITKFEAVVNFDQFEALVRAKTFPQKAWVEAYREEALTPRVTVHVAKK